MYRVEGGALGCITETLPGNGGVDGSLVGQVKGQVDDIKARRRSRQDGLLGFVPVVNQVNVDDPPIQLDFCTRGRTRWTRRCGWVWTSAWPVVLGFGFWTQGGLGTYRATTSCRATNLFIGCRDKPCRIAHLQRVQAILLLKSRSLFFSETTQSECSFGNAPGRMILICFLYQEGACETRRCRVLTMLHQKKYWIYLFIIRCFQFLELYLFRDPSCCCRRKCTFVYRKRITRY